MIHPAMKALIAVAETKSFTKAAQKLNTSQPVISRAIQRLEDEMGVRLFERNTRHVRLTTSGAALVADALQISDRWRVAVHKARLLSDSDGGRLRIGICPSAEQEMTQVSRGLYAFREAWPEVDVQVSLWPRMKQAPALRASHIDVGIMQINSSRDNGTDHAGIEWKVIARAPLMVAVPEVWNVQEKRLDLKSLSHWPWVAPHPSTVPLYEDYLELCRDAGFEPNIVAFVKDLLTRRLLVACGKGAALAYACPPNEGVHYLPLDKISDLYVADTALAWVAEAASPQIQAFVETVVNAPSSVTLASAAERCPANAATCGLDAEPSLIGAGGA